MLKKKNILILIFILFIEIIILFNPNILLVSVSEALNLFINKLFISLFPFFVLNEILLEYNLSYYISSLKYNFLSKIFNINKSSISIIILSLLTGHPSNAKYIKDYLDKGLISESEATKLLIITFFPSPVFVITVVGYLLFNNIEIGIFLLLAVYFINFLLGIIIKNKFDIIKNENILLPINNKNFSVILKNALINSFSTLFLILGNIIIFLLLLNLFNEYFNFTPIINTIFSILIEITNGIKKASILNTNLALKISLTLFALMFSGLSIHSQVSSILSDYKIDYKSVFTYRIIISIISFIFSYFLLKVLF